MHEVMNRIFPKWNAQPQSHEEVHQKPSKICRLIKNRPPKRDVSIKFEDYGILRWTPSLKSTPKAEHSSCQVGE